MGGNGAVFGWGYNGLRSSWHYGLGDLEVQAKYRVVAGSSYAAALGVLARLPTGRRDTTLEVLEPSIADHQLDFEGRVIQELTLAGRVWLNLAIRAGTQRPGTRARRVSPLDAFLVPYEATTVLSWDPGDYAAVDFAPLYRFAPQFAAGVTAGYWTKRADRYGYRSAQDSITIATALGAPTPASVLDIVRWLHDDPSQRYDYLSDVTAVEHRDYEAPIEVVWHLRSLPFRRFRKRKINRHGNGNGDHAPERGTPIAARNEIAPQKSNCSTIGLVLGAAPWRIG